jgi:hypothetical protein
MTQGACLVLGRIGWLPLATAVLLAGVTALASEATGR